MSLTRARRQVAGAWETFRVISIDELERAAAPGWRGLEEEPLGGWLLRAAAGFTGRANSALAAGDPGMPLATAAELVRSWYGGRGLPAMIAVPYPAGEPHRSELDVLLAELGWTPRARPATVMIAPADAVAGAEPAGQGGRPAGDLARVEIDDEPDAAWLGRYHYGGAELPPVARQVLMSAPWQAFASVRADGATIAIGRVAGAGRWAGLTAIEVDGRCRRRGLGRAVTAALAAAARRRGSDRLYLQVEDDNAGARALYAKLGFADHHGYHYRVAPASS
jgi:ribosomal protein S18 acetylase RimI-like enzyme